MNNGTEPKSRGPTRREGLTRCGNCGAWGLERERFCSCCGRPLPERRCNACGTQTGHAMPRFCPQCGKGLTGGTA